MATLDDVTQKLKENNIENQLGHEGTRIELTKIGRRFDNFFNIISMNKLKDLEAQRETKRKLPSAPPTRSSSGGGGLSILGGLTGLGALGATVAGIAASMTDLDEAFKALRVGQIAKSLLATGKAFNTRALSFIDSVKDFGKGLKTFGINLSRLIIIPDAVKDMFKKIPDNFLKSIYQVLGLGVDGKPVVTTSNVVKGIFSSAESEGRLAKALKPITDFFDGLGNKFASVAKYFPTINFEALKGLFGSANEGTGIIGFFSKIFSVLDPLLKPFKYIIGLALRPIFQIVLSAIDFFVGFYEGFTKDKGDLLEKLKSGFEGGIKGVIKGFTEAIDLLFIKIPAFFAEKLGFEEASKKLKTFSLTALVDPAWEAIKNFFKEAFTNPTSKLKEVTASVGNVAENFIKSILRFVLPDPNIPFSIVDPKTYVSKAIPSSVYEYAGYAKNDEGIFTLKQNTLNRSNITNKQPTDLSPTDKSSSGKGAVVNNIVGGSTTNNTNAISNNATVSTGQFMDLQDAFANYR